MTNVKNTYRDVETLITYGFLTARLRISGQTILLKSITDREYSLFDMLGPAQGDKDYFLIQLAYSTVMINEFNCLQNRQEKISRLTKLFRNLPTPVLDVMRRTVSNLNERTVEVLDYLEGYCYTASSRNLWKVLDLNSRDVYVALPGVSETGINVIQRNWAIINRSLDGEEDYDRMFHLAVLVSSSMNSKGAKDISRSHEMRKKELEELRDEIAQYGYDRKRQEQQESGWASPLNSRQDLVQELYNQMEGKKDRHDMFMEQWARKQKEKAEEAKRLAEMRAQEYRQDMKDIDLTKIEESRPVTAEEMKKALARQKEMKKSAIINQSSDSTYNAETRERVLKKMGSTILRSDN